MRARVPVGRAAFAFSRRSAAPLRRRCRPGLPVLVHDVSGRARGLRLRRVARGTSCWRRRSCGLRRSLPDRHPGVFLSQLNTRPVHAPVYDSPSPTGLPPDYAADADQVSRFSCIMFPDVRGVFDCAGSRGDFVLAPPLVWSSPFVTGSTPWSFSFTAQYPACPCPCLRFAFSLSTEGARLGVGMGHYSRKTLSFSTSCRFIPAHNESTPANEYR